ncbi:hypothetical protein ABW21_db0207262 [Orbilia brochopaga]|nr:hypothetical protein ABW21_db0207262 [Drechslerella brochopaga]
MTSLINALGSIYRRRNSPDGSSNSKVTSSIQLPSRHFSRPIASPHGANGYPKCLCAIQNASKPCHIDVNVGNRDALVEVGNVHNINAVTPEHVVPQVALAILAAIPLGLRVPIVYNTSSYDSPEALALMDGLVDIYLADFKLSSSTASKRLLKASDYPETARESIRIMQQQVGDLKFTFDGIAQTGLLVRHLVMPAYVEEGKEIMSYLAEYVSKDTYVHIMEQYRPAAHVGKAGRGKSEEVRYSDINRAVTGEEVEAVKSAAREAGLWRFVEESRHESFR